MKKKVWIPIVATTALLAVLVLAISQVFLKDGRDVDNAEKNFISTEPIEEDSDVIEPIASLREMEYAEQWLDKKTAEKYDHHIFEHIEITQIYSNCFFG